MATYTIDRKAIKDLIDNKIHSSGYDRECALQKAELVQETLMKFAEEKIQEFYDDYDPDWYPRSGNLRKAVRPYMVDHGSYIEAGIQFSAEFMSEYRYVDYRDSRYGRSRNDDFYHFLYLYPKKHLGYKLSDLRTYDVREPVLVDTLLYGVHGNPKLMWARHSPTSSSAFLQTEAYAQSAAFLSTVGLA